MKIVMIDASVKENQEITRCLEIVREYLEKADVSYRYISLKTQNISPCINCRSCTQKEGEKYGKCVFNDDMDAIVEELESGDGFIFVCPTAVFTINRMFRKFLDRLLVFEYWPIGNEKIKHRKKKTKKSIIITSNWAPYFIGKAFFNTEIVLNEACEIVGARTVGDVYLDPLIQHGNDREYIKKRVQRLMA